MNDTQNSRPIVVGVDGSSSSIAALKKAAELANSTDAPIVAVTAWQFPITYDATLPPSVWSPENDAHETLRTAVDIAFDGAPPAGLTTRAIAGPAAAVLVKASEDASMLVVGSRGRGGFVGLLLGSVSTACAQHAHCPVLIMHPPRREADAADRRDTQSHATV
ncbi:universal stress protein [Microbacterium sp. SLBN-146]|uniref:universal stress protein n=1 Tax=Microbacterium sp. SLBN-146 TaxID=2768457 RepID=UPI00114F0062|nr:universal stress protein [Microbacterium sp. SLBN-146]TQJ31525.1 nucleotide-binding universal stress UspA family protein [Microbacterium sp. SLBN-146]